MMTMRQSLGDHDPRIGPQQAIGEGGRVAVGDETDPWRLETIGVGDLMDELVTPR
jgi:hypothetical protein